MHESKIASVALLVLVTGCGVAPASDTTAAPVAETGEASPVGETIAAATATSSAEVLALDVLAEATGSHVCLVPADEEYATVCSDEPVEEAQEPLTKSEICMTACATAHAIGCAIIRGSCPAGTFMALGSLTVACEMLRMAACGGAPIGALLCTKACTTSATWSQPPPVHWPYHRR